MQILNEEPVLVSAGDLKTHPFNPRRGDIPLIRESIQVNGFYGALIVQKSTDFILAGNHRFQAGLEEGGTEFPVFYVDVDDKTAVKILLADNRTSDFGATNPQQALDILDSILEEYETLEGSGYDEQAVKDLRAMAGFDPNESSSGALGDFKATSIIEVGDYKFSIGYDPFEEWIEDLRQDVGFDPASIKEEILCRLRADMTA